MQRVLDRFAKLAGRVPWLLPAVSFAAGWAGFVMVQRGEELARLMALLALVGWPWLLVEPWIRRALEKRRPRLGKVTANFVSQSIQQELLFFSLPFLIGASERDTGQVIFTSLAAAAAVVTTIDPLYERYVARRAARRLAFHAYCSWIAALVVLPMVLLLPLERALPLSLVAVAESLVLTFPLSLPSLPGWGGKAGWIARVVLLPLPLERALPWSMVSVTVSLVLTIPRCLPPPRVWGGKAVWIAAVVLLPLVLWTLRGHVPAAVLAVTEARITQSIEGLIPGAPV